MLDAADVPDIAKAMHEQLVTERRRLDRIDRYLAGEQDKPYQPKSANDEYRKLAARSVSNLLPMVLSSQAQRLFIEGYRPGTPVLNEAGQAEPTLAWRAWQANGMDRRQAAIFRAALAYGWSYAVVTPGDPLPVMRGVGPRQMHAVYFDPAEDDFPEHALQVRRTFTKDGKRAVSVWLYDDAQRWSVDLVEGRPEVIEVSAHDLGVCPVVRFTDRMDLEGRAFGQVEPLIPMQDRINQTTFDLLLAQTYGAFKVRTVSGMELPQVDTSAEPTEQAKQRAERRAAQVELAASRFLVAEDDSTKFGQLDETPLDGYINSLDTAMRHLAVVSQTPPVHLLGEMSNLSAEALAAAEAGGSRLASEHQHSFGESGELTLRLASLAAGDLAGWDDVAGQVVWRDTGSQSLSQTVDALGKAVQLLQIPAQALWERIPGVTQTDVDRWSELAARGDSLAGLTAVLDSQAGALGQ